MKAKNRLEAVKLELEKIIDTLTEKQVEDYFDDVYEMFMVKPKANKIKDWLSEVCVGACHNSVSVHSKTITILDLGFMDDEQTIKERLEKSNVDWKVKLKSNVELKKREAFCALYSEDIKHCLKTAIIGVPQEYMIGDKKVNYMKVKKWSDYCEVLFFNEGFTDSISRGVETLCNFSVYNFCKELKLKCN